MNSQVQEFKNYDAPAFAGTFRFLLGLAVMLVGAYLVTLTEIKGHGLGFLLIFASPFLIMKDDK